MKKKEFPYQVYHQGDKPTVYCIVCSRQITNVNKDGKSALPFMAGIIAPENFNGRCLGTIGICQDCAEHAVQDGRINVFELPPHLYTNPDEETVFGL